MLYDLQFFQHILIYFSFTLSSLQITQRLYAQWGQKLFKAQSCTSKVLLKLVIIS